MQVSVRVEKGRHEAISQLKKFYIVQRRIEQQHFCWSLALALPAFMDRICRQEGLEVDNTVNLQFWPLKSESWHIVKQRKKVGAWIDNPLTNTRVGLCAARTVFIVDFCRMNYIGVMISNARSFESWGFLQKLVWIYYNFEWSITNKIKWETASDQKQVLVLIQNIS